MSYEIARVIETFSLLYMINTMNNAVLLNSILNLDQSESFAKAEEDNFKLNRYESDIQTWLRENHSLESVIRYMLVSLNVQITGMYKMSNLVSASDSGYVTKRMRFSEAHREFMKNPIIAAKFKMFEEVFGRPLRSYSEYRKLFSMSYLENISYENLITYVKYGKY